MSTFDLIAIDDQRTHVIWSFHHLLLDGWSTARVVGDVLDLYESDGATTPGATGAGAAEESSFRPYLEWLADRDTAETTEFWRSLLAGVTEPSLLANLRGRHDTGSTRARNSAAFERGRLDITLATDDSDRVRAAAASNRITVNTMVQAAWARTLARYTGRPEVIFGVTVSGRPPELDGANETVGMFLNTLPFPVTVPADSYDAGWLQGLQRQQLDVSHHGHASLAEVQRLAPVPAATARLFDSILVFENYPMRTTSNDTSVQVEHYGVFEQSHYPLTIMAGDMPDGGALGFIVVYDESVLAPWFARQLIDDFTAALLGLGTHRSGDPATGAHADLDGGQRAWQASDADRRRRRRALGHHRRNGRSARPSTPPSLIGHSRTPRILRFAVATRPSPSPSSMLAPPSLPANCSGEASAPRFPSALRSSARSTWWSPSSAW